MHVEIPEDVCCKCHKFKVINKTYQLCRFCNHERTHNGENIFQTSSKKAKEKREEKVSRMKQALLKDPLLNDQCCSITGCLNKKFTKKNGGLCLYHFNIEKNNQKQKKAKKRTYVSQQSIRQKKIKQELSVIKNEEKQKHYDQTGNTCEGCLKSFPILDYSHILSVGQRPDLELVRENKNLLCRKCHEKWESWDPNIMFTLACIDYNITYLRKIDKESFWKLYFKCVDNLMMVEAKKMETIDEDFKLNNNA